MIDYNQQFYNQLIRKKLDKSFLTVGWGSKKTQKIRFENIYKYFDKNNFSVLDVGCGLGDFYLFLKKKKNKFRYTGIDINETFIKKCKRKYKNVNFINSHFLRYKIKTKPDYIIISGALNLPMDNYLILLKKIILKMHKNSKEKSIFNLLSSSSKKIYQFNAYTNIGKLSEYIDTIAKHYLIDKTYLSHDISVIIHSK